jgi:tRNA A-37 threonylcarbamoyl transferase component Bud32
VTAQVGPATPHRMIGERYALFDLLGRGGMGAVWRAEDRVIGRWVAVKELRLPDGVTEREREVFQERVLREARSAGRLNDPAVVTVYDVVNEAGATYIVMELVEAPTLSQVVQGGGPLPPASVAALGEQVLIALEAAHAAGIVHRDVKPSNIMVLPSGRVKLADFGIAQAADDPKLTTSGMLIGSPGYMAPERVRGGDASPASDLWALGTVLWFAVEGKSPFERTTTAATLHAIVNELPPLTRCQGQLASVIMGLLIGDPQSRLTGPQVHALLHVPGPGFDVTTPLGPATPTGNGTMRAQNAPGHPTQAAWPTATVAQRRPRRTGLRVLAAVVALVVAAGLGVGGYLLGHHAGAAGPSAMSPTLTYGGSDAQLPQFGLGVGSCGSGRITAGRSFTSDESVPCDRPHDFEVFASGSALDASAKVGAPDPKDLAHEAEGVCTVVFGSSLVTQADKDTTLTYAALVPSPRAWQSDPDSETGTRSMLCVLWNEDETQLTHSALASGS